MSTQSSALSHQKTGHMPVFCFDPRIDRMEIGMAPNLIEEDSGSRWVMFYDPAGNRIEPAQFKYRLPTQTLVLTRLSGNMTVRVAHAERTL